MYLKKNTCQHFHVLPFYNIVFLWKLNDAFKIDQQKKSKTIFINIYFLFITHAILTYLLIIQQFQLSIRISTRNEERKRNCCSYMDFIYSQVTIEYDKRIKYIYTHNIPKQITNNTQKKKKVKTQPTQPDIIQHEI